MRTRLTQFQRQCEALQDGMASGLAELHTLVAPSAGTDDVRRALSTFEGKDTVDLSLVHDSLRHRFPRTTKRQLLRLVRQHRTSAR